MPQIFKNIYVYGYGYQGKLLDIYLSDTGQVSFWSNDYPSNTTPLDIQGRLTLMPGLIDTHLHGAQGYDFTDVNEESLAIVAEGLAKCGLAYFMATLFSLEIKKLKKTLTILDHYFVNYSQYPQPGKANLIGIHLEGPFISKSCAGSHDENILQNEINLEIFRDILAAAPNIQTWKITLSPDISGTFEFIQDLGPFLNKNPTLNVKIFIGHTNADEQLINRAMTEGKGIVIGFTHVGNACMEKSHRNADTIVSTDIHSNVVRWLTDPRNQTHFFIYEVIADGVHLSPNFIHFLRSQCGSKKLMLVSDQLAPTDKVDGEYSFGKHKILKQRDKCVLKANPQKLAGSVMSLPRMFETYATLLQINQTNLMQELYTATVLNPRLSMTNHNIALTDKKNYIIVDSNSGKIMLSACNGKIINHGLHLHRLNDDKKI